jgi:hypothetical protein
MPSMDIVTTFTKTSGPQIVRVSCSGNLPAHVDFSTAPIAQTKSIHVIGVVPGTRETVLVNRPSPVGSIKLRRRRRKTTAHA